jgi:hypothetical protein
MSAACRQLDGGNTMISSSRHRQNESRQTVAKPLFCVK